MPWRLPSITILQIGDVHYREAVAASTVDRKDRRFPVRILNQVVPHPLRSVIEAIVRRKQALIDSGNVVALAIMGDLATGSSADQSDEYSDCVKYLVQSLNIPTLADTTHVEVGNHDVDWSAIDPLDLFRKFEMAEGAWASHGLPVLASRSPKITPMRTAGSQVTMFSINSSIGCGEQRYLPDKAIDAIHRAIRSGLGTIADFGVEWEQLDTPAIMDSDLDTVCTQIRALGQGVQPVVLAHHNLLPQHLTLAKLYGELVGGGAVRARLAACDRSVLFLHGHVHDDVIEIIDQKHPGVGRLVAIASPLITTGFNEIEIQFTRHGVPAGCEITHYRSHNGDVRHREPFRISLITDAPAWGAFADVLAPLVPDITLLFDRLRAQLNPPTPQRAHLAERLLEAEWRGLVVIQNRSQQYKHWRVSLQ